ncbi:ribosome maturation factor RimP [Cellulomonas persica]|uniref:Ribosome maturation factor RimP n=1 Tax=Cellulomonas persica TaxID=76861 RepID=A0A510USU1_9CELL|nr:ribosome maturation factor RimP [Cellulomonas persica]GEK16270.1 ribosome maturation factor RimP [Cellulomonas persica]
MVAAAASAQRVNDVLTPVVSAEGLVLEEVRVRRSGGRVLVEVLVGQTEDDERELDLDRIADVTRAVSDALDASDPVAGEYTLEVGTRGADSPLVERRHFVRAVGRAVRVRRTDGTVLAGRLTGVEDDAIVVVPVTPGVKGRPPRVGTPVTIVLDEVADARVEVDMSGLGPDDDGGDDAGQES